MRKNEKVTVVTTIRDVVGIKQYNDRYEGMEILNKRIAKLLLGKSEIEIFKTIETTDDYELINIKVKQVNKDTRNFILLEYDEFLYNNY